MRRSPKVGTNRFGKVEEKHQSLRFQSVTQNFIELSKAKILRCPRCETAIDFKATLDWHGPTSFSCNDCGKLLHMSNITRDLEKMGLLDRVFLR